MENEQALEASIQEPTAEATPAEKKVEAPAFVAPSEEEFNKAIQSASSKAKFAILQELGVKSVDEFKALKASYETSIKDAGETKTKLKESEANITSLKEDIATMKAGVADDYKDDFLTLVHSKMSDTVSFEDAAKEVLDKNPTWKVGTEPIKLGNDKSETKIDSSDERRRKNILRMAGL